MCEGQSEKDAVFRSIKNILKERDSSTAEHADRIEILATKLAEYIGNPFIKVTSLKLLANFHDLGKVGIPESILFKNGSLTAEEYSVIKDHCRIGWRIALSIPDLAPIADWILKHHEWWNGKGYPLGIEGEEIPIESRLIAIVDAYDAMTNDRTYRKAISPEKAVEELQRCAGTQFDPLLVNSFVRLIGTQEERGCNYDRK